MLKMSRYEKPWLAKKDPKEKWEKIIFWGSVLAGFAIGGILCVLSWNSVSNKDVSAKILGLNYLSTYLRSEVLHSSGGSLLQYRRQ
jgi:hypothetical protein